MSDDRSTPSYTRGREQEHAHSRHIIDAMVRRLRYLEVKPPWPDTRSLLWQAYCAAKDAERKPFKVTGSVGPCGPTGSASGVPLAREPEP